MSNSALNTACVNIIALRVTARRYSFYDVGRNYLQIYLPGVNGEAKFCVVAFFHWNMLELFTRFQWNHGFKPTVPMQFSNFSSLIRANEYYEIILKHYNCSLEIMFRVHLYHYCTEVEHREQLSTTLFCEKKHECTNILNLKWLTKTRTPVRNIKMPTCYLPQSQTQCCYLSYVLNLMYWSVFVTPNTLLFEVMCKINIEWNLWTLELPEE